MPKINALDFLLEQITNINPIRQIKLHHLLKQPISLSHFRLTLFTLNRLHLQHSNNYIRVLDVVDYVILI